MAYGQIRVDLRKSTHCFRTHAPRNVGIVETGPDRSAMNSGKKRFFPIFRKKIDFKKCIFFSISYFFFHNHLCKSRPSNKFVLQKYDTIFDRGMKPKNAYKHLTVYYIINIVYLFKYL